MNSSLTGDISEVFSKFTKFPVVILSGSVNKARFFTYHVITCSVSHVTRSVRFPHPKSQRL